MEEMKDMEAFRLMVRRLIVTGSPIRIDNGSSEHARVILEEMFRHAQRTAFVFCGCISMSVWGSETMAACIEDAICNRGVDVHFIVQNPDKIPAASPTVAMLRRHPGTIVTSPLFKDFESHFAVFDQKMYRIEKNDAEKTANAYANNRENGAELDKLAKLMSGIAEQV